MASKQLQAVKSALRSIWPPHPSSGGMEGFERLGGRLERVQEGAWGSPVLLELFPKPSWTLSSSCLPGILPHPRREGERLHKAGDRGGCSGLQAEPVPISPVVETGKLGWEQGEGAAHPQWASPCATLSQRQMSPKSDLHVLKSHCRQGAEHSSCSGSTEVMRRSSSLPRGALTPMFLLQKNQDINTNCVN